ncbi:CPBP family intramembrane glutamic endopeptidase [Cumulibacter manganitolerans]|uniref:CPBP family intramembrane glutamic endopeptidase n=1 Tax=Cumulibacter manganitolerans TaxID=1884992 RepID=UPI0012956013|nr:CPBP family intramembrane glutamic endopeptidase [Cumulibacter manganitolerans]
MIDRVLVPSELSAYGTATAAALLIGGYLLVGEPYVGAVLHRRFEAAAHRYEDARRWLYRRLLLLEWGLAALCLATVALAPHVDLAAVGVRPPDAALGWGISAAAALAALAFAVTTAREIARSGGSGQLPAGSEAVVVMLPRTPVERRLFALVAVTAGVCEELVFRGYLTALVAALVPGAPVWVCLVAAAVAFGLAHLYQGAPGVVGTFLVGIALGGLYVVTGSLLAPVLVHVLIDLRAISLGRLAVAPLTEAAHAEPTRHLRRGAVRQWVFGSTRER